MAPNLEKVVREALKLPTDQRAALAGTLIGSLEQDVDDDAEAAWSREIARRVREIESGSVKLVPWSAVRRRIRAKIRGGTKS